MAFLFIFFPFHYYSPFPALRSFISGFFLFSTFFFFYKPSFLLFKEKEKGNWVFCGCVIYLLLYVCCFYKSLRAYMRTNCFFFWFTKLFFKGLVLVLGKKGGRKEGRR
ncbi:hypothetical protein F4810DRAFT_673560 [Camillea tinctor]|nr:hypothetical protein F4810DRAFT_673560 [Camillea tinctor]